MKLDLKGRILKLAYRDWPRSPELVAGYSVLLAMPADMPFLLRFALEGLKYIDLDHCNEVLVVPDGFGGDGGAALSEVVREFKDPRVELVLPRWIDVQMMQRTSVAHWVCIVCGTRRVRSRYVFLHDADAFFVDGNTIERMHGKCDVRSMYSLGVEARWDPFFQKAGYTIPGTWEMMYSTEWLRRHPPHLIHGRRRQTPFGENEFDTLLYPQYLDYGSGKVGIMENPPRFLHFYGTIVTYRAAKKRSKHGVVDELYRILLLSMLEDLVPAPDGRKLLPTVDELARGLTDPNAPIRYDSEVARRGYGEFRHCLEELCDSPVFVGKRAARIHEMIIPFDEHFNRLALDGAVIGDPIRKFRMNGLA